jgi:hypothetical protein
MSRRAVLVAVALPLLAIVLGIVRAELFLTGTRDFVLEMRGYDPRDLLRGHYLQFRLQVDPLHEREPCDPATGEACCLCLTRAAPGALSVAERATCATARTVCDGALPLEVLARGHRFYVPEARAAELERRVRAAMARGGAHAVLAIGPDGTLRVRELRVDGEAVPGSIAAIPTAPPDDAE